MFYTFPFHLKISRFIKESQKFASELKIPLSSATTFLRWEKERQFNGNTVTMINIESLLFVRHIHTCTHTHSMRYYLNPYFTDEGNWGSWCLLLAEGHKARQCCSLDSNPGGPTSRVTDLKPNLTLPTFLLFCFNYLLSFTLCGEHLHKHYVILPLQPVNKVGLIMPVFSMRKTNFNEIISQATELRAKL